MTEIINEKWIAAPIGLQTSYISFIDPDGDPSPIGEVCDQPTAQHIVDIHNFIVEHGGLEKVKAIVEVHARIVRDVDAGAASMMVEGWE